MEFMRAVSILFLVIHVYWYCYQAFSDMGISIGIVDKILLNFQRTAGLFRSLLLTKVFALIFLALSCLGTKGVKNRDMTWNKIYAFFLGGLVLFFMNWWMLELPVSSIAKAGLYTATLTTGYILMLMAGVWVSRMLKNDLMDDVFNMENESFMQNTVLMENEYSVNLPTKFVYQKKEWDGWINIVNPFRATIVLGTPGSGKSFAVVNSYIKQQISKGFAVYIYDYKFDDLSIIAYNELLKNLDKYKVKSTFFLVGDWVKNYPDSVKDIAKHGHDVGNHSNTHPHMTQMSSSDMVGQIQSCNEKIKELTGKTPTLFRAPYGDYNNDVVKSVNGCNMYCVQWDVDSLDWKDPTPEQIKQNIMKKIKNGSIILMHNGAKNTPEALPTVIEAIKSEGYEIVPISQILLKGEYYTDVDGKMCSKTATQPSS